jgi:hypothetical protein
MGYGIDDAVGDGPRQRFDPRVQRAAIVPPRKHVQPDHCLGLLELLDQVEAAQHRQQLR